MKTARILLWSGIFVLACGIAMPASSAELKTGQKVWSKHFETPLLAEHSPLASVLSTVGFAEKLSILETRGGWLRVKSGSAEGWVFNGNIATDKPAMAPAAGWTKVDATKTNTVAAARPLTPAAEGYAQRHGASDAQADIDWLDAESALVTAQDITAYMAANQKGEYQE